MPLREIMSIHVHLFAYLAKYSPTGREKFNLDLGPGTTLSQLLEKFKIPSGIEKRVLVNGRHADPSVNLVDGDDVFIYPPAAGG
jgi:molybdopterin converting factor small subunit